MRIALGADHAGLELKEKLASFLSSLGHEVEDHGTHSTQSVDYPDYAAAVGRTVQAGDADRGLVVCGTGVGVSIAANKISGVRAANCNDLFTARLARGHNNVNVLALGARIIAPELAEEITRTFLETEWEGGRHGRRIDKIHGLESS